MTLWKMHFAQARSDLEAFRAAEASWLQSLGDPRVYHSDPSEATDQYLAVFPQVPTQCCLLLSAALRSASAGLERVALALMEVDARKAHHFNSAFPFATSRADFFGPAHTRRLAAFPRKIREILTDIAPYPDGDDKLFALHVLAKPDTYPALAPFATVVKEAPPKIGILHIQPRTAGKLVKEPVAADVLMGVAGPNMGWSFATNTLEVARWSRRPNIHVEARVQAWIVFAPDEANPACLRGKPAHLEAGILIERGAALAADLAKLADAKGC